MIQKYIRLVLFGHPILCLGLDGITPDYGFMKTISSYFVSDKKYLSTFVLPPIRLSHIPCTTPLTIKRLNACVHSLMIIILTLTRERSLTM